MKQSINTAQGLDEVEIEELDINLSRNRVKELMRFVMNEKNNDNIKQIPGDWKN